MSNDPHESAAEDTESELTAAVVVRNLCKTFNSLKAVDNISFRIEQGRIFGLLGPNGAGKSTTLAMLATLSKPTSGGAWVNGYDVRTSPDDVRRSIGIVFQDQSLDEELTARENMDFHGRLYKVPTSVRRQRIAELLTLVGLEDRQNDLVKTFSGGMRRRLEIARGLLHRPRVLYLDEPTLGLDPQTRNHLWLYIERLSQEHEITVILTTHYMEEADRLCDRIAIIDHGKIIASGTPAELKARVGDDTVTLASSDDARLVAALDTLPFVKSLESGEDGLVLKVESAERHVAEIVTLAINCGVGIQSILVHQPTLEDVFLDLTGHSIREEEASGKERMRMARRMWGRR